MLKEEIVQSPAKGEYTKIRKTGIPVIGDAPWGTHFCQFYQTKEDLLDILVPYFKAGLESNEFCMWVTSEPLSGKEAEEAMRRAVPDFDHYLKRGQIEIVPYDEWYLKHGVFNSQRVLNAWVNKLEQALAKGYDGLRLIGNTFWLEKRDWKNFADYEEEVNSVIGKYPMMAVCTYSIEKCSASEVIDVVRNHQFALIKRGGEWELIESSEIKRAKEAMRELEEKYRKLVENSKDSIVVIDLNGNVQFANKATEELTGFTSEDGIRMNVRKITPLKYWRKSLAMLLKARKGEQIPYFESMIRRKDGKLVPVESGGQAIFKDGKAVGIQIITRDITERKKTEDALRKSENEFRTLLENLPQKIFFKDRKSVYVSCNENYGRDLKIKSDEIAGRTDYDFYPKGLAEKYRADDKRIMESGKTEDIEEEYIQDGQKGFVYTVKTPVKDESGNVVGVLGVFWDVTKRKKAEEALGESEEKWRSLVENAPNVILIVDRDGKIQFINRTVIGASPEEMIGRSIYNYIDPKYHNEVRKTIEQVFQTGEGGNYDVSGTGPDGGTSWYKTQVGPIKHVGQVVSVTLLTTDITEIKKTEESLRKSEEKYRSLFDNARDLILTVDLEGNITSANNILREYGYDKNELIGKSLFNVFPKEYLQRFRDFFRDFNQGKPVEGEFKIKSKAKQEDTIVEYKGNPIIQNNKTVGVQVIIRDITERKKMEERIRQYSEHLEEFVQKRTTELLESEKRYSVLVEEASDGVVILQDEKIVFANKRVADILGYSRDEIVELPIDVPVSKNHRQLAIERYQRRLRGEDVPATYEIDGLSKTGEPVPLELSVARINYLGHPASLVLVRDIRKRKQMEEQHLKLEKLATLSEVATMVGHDLRNPLQSIENAAYYLNSELSNRSASVPISQKIMEMLKVINDSIDYADKIILDLQDFSATKKPILEKTDINAVVKETMSQFQIPKNVKLISELDRLPEIKADKNQMKRVFLNLTSNALQAMENGGTLTVSTTRANGFVEVSFKDTGAGIAKEDIKKLFTPLFTTKAKGMGMGLPICKKFVESHGGSIEVETEEGKGSTFRVKLPLSQENGGENH